MSTNAAKTYDGQTARFIASVVTCMPKLPAQLMQVWVNDPKGLKMALSQTLSENCEMSSSTSEELNSLSLGERFDNRWERKIDEQVAEAAPRRLVSRGSVHYFSHDQWLKPDGLLEKYEQRGLVPADPHLLAMLEADTYTGRARPRVTVWQDADGQWCYMSLQHGDRSPRVEIGHVWNKSWHPGWYFAGEYE